MDQQSILFISALVIGFYMAWNIGANDVANAIGTSVGSKALKLRQAVVLAAVFEFCGALFVGSEVSGTIQKGIVSPDLFIGEPYVLAYGMMASLLSAGVWLQVASYFGWPVSTTHTIVGAVLGFGAVYGGIDAVNWGSVNTIVMSWILSPLLGGAFAYIFFKFLSHRIFYHESPIKAVKRLTPFLVFWVVLILSMVTIFKGLKNLHLDLSFSQAIFFSVLVSLFSSLISRFLVRKFHVTSNLIEKKDWQDPRIIFSLEKVKKHLKQAQSRAKGDFYFSLESCLKKIVSFTEMLKKGKASTVNDSEGVIVEKVFIYLQILSAACMAFAHGANDVANAIGPLAAIVSILKTGAVSKIEALPLWILFLGGGGIVIGLATWGWRVVDTIGKGITELTPSRGFVAEISAATTILVASKLGLPVSTTHTLVGAVLGVGFARGIGALNLNTIRDIVLSWVVTVPAGAGLAIAFFYILKGIFTL